MVGFSSLVARYARPRALRIVTRRLARCLVVAPAALIAYLFIARPEALGSPGIKLGLMAGAAFLLMVAGELSEALTRWALPWLKARAAAAEVRAPAQCAEPSTVLEVLSSATLTAAPQSSRFG